MSLNPNSLSAALDMYELCVFLKGLLREARSSSPTEFCSSRAASLLRTCCSPFIFSEVHKKLVHSMIPPNPNATKDDTTLIMV